MGQEMSDAPRQPPPKKDVALALLEESSMFIHLDPRRPDVLVPKGFMGQPQLVLQVGLNMAIPIPDLHIDEIGISCTLSFNRSPFWCRIPWTAIYALVGEDGRGGVWAEDVPVEIQQQKQSTPSKGGGKKPRPKLTAVGASGSARPREAGEAGPSATGATGPKPRRGLASVPAPAAPVAEDDGILEAEPKRPQLSAVPRQPAEVSGGSSGSDDPIAEPSQPADAKKPKREIPPYLRVIK
jgi:hypothetical protein